MEWVVLVFDHAGIADVEIERTLLLATLNQPGLITFRNNVCHLISVIADGGTSTISGDRFSVDQPG